MIQVAKAKIDFFFFLGGGQKKATVCTHSPKQIKPPFYIHEEKATFFWEMKKETQKQPFPHPKKKTEWKILFFFFLEQEENGNR